MAEKIATDPLEMMRAELRAEREMNREMIGELARALKPQDGLDRMGISEAEKNQIRALPQPQKFRQIPCVSPETGATFVAHVVESKAHPHGRITQLAGYTHPREAYLTTAQGGLLAEGFNIWDKGEPQPLPREGEGEPAMGLFNAQFKHWRWENFYKRDLQRYADQGMTQAICAAPDGLKTPWIDSRVGAIAA